jgi:hypothetical protein
LDAIKPTPVPSFEIRTILVARIVLSLSQIGRLRTSFRSPPFHPLSAYNVSHTTTKNYYAQFRSRTPRVRLADLIALTHLVPPPAMGVFPGVVIQHSSHSLVALLHAPDHDGPSHRSRIQFLVAKASLIPRHDRPLTTHFPLPFTDRDTLPISGTDFPLPVPD